MFLGARPSLTNLSKFSVDEPLCLVTSSAFFFHSEGFLLISFPSSSSITSLLFDLLAVCFIDICTHSQTLQAYLQFAILSSIDDHQIIGKPTQRLSIIEFQPQCVKNHPIEGWERTTSCRHQLINKPPSLVYCMNSLGSVAVLPRTISDRRTTENCAWYLQAPMQTL